MFTGIVEELGEIVTVEQLADAARLTVRGPRVTAEAQHGDSIAVNGVCLTVTDSTDKTFTADVMAETLQRTGLGALTPGAPVNLERPVQLGGRLGGHLVQGHADGTGVILSRSPSGHPGGSRASGGSGVSPGQQSVPPGQQSDVVRIALPAELRRYVVLKGSVTVDGVSLTVSGLSGADEPEPWFEVSLIPTTLELTTLGRRPPGSQVNLEVDVIAKYVESLFGERS